ncbi:MAG: toll/interleukin-1 receptor domain-containing protein [Sphingomonas sp.]|nr:toll/interleukin-1 receptor domain-containing protein [Sphingomonas sp.]
MSEVAQLLHKERDRSAGGRDRPIAVPHALYFAFLSYSHSDAGWGEWLHDALEKFRVPSSIAGRLTSQGVVPRRLTPIFRDRKELAVSGDLETEIREALVASRYLIVLCSPAAANSRWTNAEIDTFKRVRPDGCVLAAIVDGEPFASDIAGREAEECLPPALRVHYDRRGRPTSKRSEPLCTDLRDNRDGKRLGLLKLVAGMLGVGLDDLVQRETVRRQRRLAMLAAASLAGMAITSTLAVTAIQARDAARDQRREAEGLVGFMLGDLRDKLEPIGRLDALDAVGARALAYYEHQDKASLSDASLAQRSKALTLMGQIASERGNVDSALRLYREAFESTAELLRREPEDAQRVFDHAQNVFYVGDVARQRGDMREAEASLHEYKRLATKLIETDPSNPKWQMEGIYADSNLGIMLLESGRYGEAASVFENSLADREKLAAGAPDNDQFRKALVSVLAWLAEAREKEGRLDDGLAQRERQIALLQPYINDTKSDAQYRRDALVAYRAAGRLNAVRGNRAKGLEQLRTSVQIGEELIEAEPQNTDWASMTAYAKFELARFELAQRNTDQAAALTRSGCDMADRLVAKDSSVVDWRLDLRAWCLQLKARIAVAQGAFVEAEGWSDRLRQLAVSEAKKTPSPDAQLEVANAELTRGLVARAAGLPAAATDAFRKAANNWPKRVPDRPPLLARKVLILSGLGRRDAANAIALRLDRMGYRDPTYMRDRALLSP